MTSSETGSSTSVAEIENLLRQLTPQVLGQLTRRTGDFNAGEDAVQEALVAAATHWPIDGIPENPSGWLYSTARNRLLDHIRAETARRRREQTVSRLAEPLVADAFATHRDDTLTLYFLCCHPVLPEPAQIALTLRSVGGLTTAEIAAAYLVPEATIGQRISRAKRRLTEAGASFAMPSSQELQERLRTVLAVLYVIFTEGHTASSGARLTRVDLTAEAIRLTRELRRLIPEDGEVAGLLALMLLTDARRSARVAPDGSLVPLDEQDRRTWHKEFIDEGTDVVTRALRSQPLGPYQVQAAIAAVHAEAATMDDTDWVQILGLYDLLEQIQPSPVVSLNRAVALARVQGPGAALQLLDRLATDDKLARHHRLPAVRAHLLHEAGHLAAARMEYLAAARRTASTPERRYLEQRAAGIAEPGDT